MSYSIFKGDYTIGRDPYARFFIPALAQHGEMAASVSRVGLELEVVGKGSVTCELMRHLSPITCRAILNALPVQGRLHRMGELFAYFETGLVIGSEKQRSQFKRGEMALLVSNGGVCIFLKDGSSQPMNPLGRVTGDVGVIESAGRGDVVALKRPTA